MRPPDLRRLLETYQLATGSVAASLALGGRPVAATRHAGTVEVWQFVCGEGPAIDALTTGCSVEVTDTNAQQHCWPMLTDALRTWPYASLLTLSLSAQPGMGTLTLHYPDTGSRSSNEHAAALACARHATEWLTTALASPSTVDLGDYDLINCATGIVIAQTGLTPDDATTIIRAHAYTSPRDLHTLLHDIIDLRLNVA